jgi:hypothetical protein
LCPSYLLLYLLQSESFPLFFLLASQLLLLFIHATSACHVVLGLRQKILALTGLQACQCYIIPQAVPMDRQVVEVPVAAGKMLIKLACNTTTTLLTYMLSLGDIWKSQTKILIYKYHIPVAL